MIISAAPTQNGTVNKRDNIKRGNGCVSGFDTEHLFIYHQYLIILYIIYYISTEFNPGVGHKRSVFDQCIIKM